jgi:hypothetical protein
MSAIPSGLATVAYACLDSGVLSLSLYGDDRQRLHRRGQPKRQLPGIIRKPHSRPTILGLILTDASLLFAWGRPICKLTGKQWLVRELP